MQNLDTDLQYAYLTGIRDYVLKNKGYLMQQVGNPDGDVCVNILFAETDANTAKQDKPNKKYYDPRVWVREGEKTMTKRVEQGLKEFNTAGQV